MRITRRVLSVALTISFLASPRVAITQSRSAASIKSEEDLTVVLGQVNQPEAHLKAFSTLVQFAALGPMPLGESKHSTGEPIFDALEDKTHEFLNGYVILRPSGRFWTHQTSHFNAGACRRSRPPGIKAIRSQTRRNGWP